MNEATPEPPSPSPRWPARWLLALAAGTLHAACAAGALPPGLLPLAFALVVGASQRGGPAPVVGAAFGAGFVLPFVPALYGAGRVTLGLEPLVAAGFVALLAGGRALPWALFSFACARLPRRPASSLLCAGACWLTEGLQRLVWQGLALGECSAALGWPSTAPWVVAGCAWCGALAWRREARASAVVWLAAPSLLLLLPPRGAGEAPAHPPLRVLVISADLPAAAASLPELALERYLELSSRALSRIETPVDLIVWPEGAVSLDLASDPARTRGVAQRLQVGRHRPHLLLGCLGTSPRGPLNLALLLDPRGASAGTYARQHLLPFGESPRWSRGLFSRRAGVDFVAGPSTPPPLVLERPGCAPRRIRVLLCAEGLEPSLSDPAERMDLLVVLASDGVFPEHADGLRVLLDRSTAQRALECRAPLLRVASCGPSSFTDSRGRRTVLREPGATAAALLEIQR